MKTLQLPGQLIASLTEPGLLDSEAKMYAALVLLGYTDLGDLLEILDVSKPRIYTSLGTLEEKGLIIRTSEADQQELIDKLSPPLCYIFGD
jgi:sugar-specific transcriptional regulator TrmB